jgi:hemoglobin-like flavoprotein
MFGFGSDYDEAVEAMYSHPAFIAHSRILFSIVDAAVGLIHEGKVVDLGDTLTQIGKRHFQYGVQSVHYPIVGEALMFTLQAALGETFTAEVSDAWQQVYAVIFSGMLEGAFYEEFYLGDDEGKLKSKSELSLPA